MKQKKSNNVNTIGFMFFVAVQKDVHINIFEYKTCDTLIGILLHNYGNLLE
jgi:hypothetical protein